MLSIDITYIREWSEELKIPPFFRPSARYTILFKNIRCKDMIFLI